MLLHLRLDGVSPVPPASVAKRASDCTFPATLIRPAARVFVHPTIVAPSHPHFSPSALAHSGRAHQSLPGADRRPGTDRHAFSGSLSRRGDALRARALVLRTEPRQAGSRPFRASIPIAGAPPASRCFPGRLAARSRSVEAAHPRLRISSASARGPGVSSRMRSPGNTMPSTRLPSASTARTRLAAPEPHARTKWRPSWSTRLRTVAALKSPPAARTSKRPSAACPASCLAQLLARALNAAPVPPLLRSLAPVHRILERFAGPEGGRHRRRDRHHFSSAWIAARAGRPVLRRERAESCDPHFLVLCERSRFGHKAAEPPQPVSCAESYASFFYRHTRRNQRVSGFDIAYFGEGTWLRSQVHSDGPDIVHIW